MKTFYITFSMSSKGWDDDDYNPYAGYFYANVEAENATEAKGKLRKKYDDMDLFFEKVEEVA